MGIAPTIMDYARYNYIAQPGDKNIRFVDKTLENFFNVDIILNLFPNAKFLHCFRNLNESVIAIFQSLLPTLSWTHNLDDIVNDLDNALKIS